MRKPFSFWSWNSLKSWRLVGGQKRDKKHRARSMRMETLSPRIVLAGDMVQAVSGVDHNELVPFADATEGDLSLAQNRIVDEQSPQTALYDINRDDAVSPIDVQGRRIRLGGNDRC